jgi:type IV pilus assembly protein PilM
MKIQVTRKKSVEIGMPTLGKPSFSRSSGSGGGGTVGLDVETGSIAATEVKDGGKKVGRTAIAPLEPGVVNEGEVQDADALSAALSDLFSQNKLGKSVRLGIANQRVVVRTLRLPLIEDDEELDTAIRFQAQEHIPMPLDQAVLDHYVVSKGTGPEGERQMEVVAVAARRDMVTSLLGALRKAGLRPIGIDLSAFGMIRALSGNGNGSAAAPAEGQIVPTSLYCHLGDITNLAVARGGECVFTRIATFGMEDIATKVAEGEDMPMEDARDLLLEVGLEESIDAFSDDQGSVIAAREALDQGASKLVDELRLSLEFYGAQEDVPAIDHVVVCGPGSTVPGLPQRIQEGLGLGIETLSPHALDHLDPEDAARLTVSYGLALES